MVPTEDAFVLLGEGQLASNYLSPASYSPDFSIKYIIKVAFFTVDALRWAGRQCDYITCILVALYPQVILS